MLYIQLDERRRIDLGLLEIRYFDRGDEEKDDN